MSLHASWTHGTALNVETPQNLDRVGYFGWGADMAVKPGKGSWFHIPLPTPVIVSEGRTQISTLFLLFDAVSGSIRNVHIYDGSSQVQQFNDLLLEGEHRLGLDAANTFNLAAPHTVIFGIGITFFFIADIGFDSSIPPARLIIGAAGGDFFA